VDRDTLNISADTVRAVVEREYRQAGKSWRHKESGGRLAAIVPVHFGGHMCDMAAFVSLGADLGVPVMDDAAHALPASIGGRSVGTFGCPTAFSFYATKTLTTAEGGMLTTDDADIAARVRLMALHGISRDAWKRYTADGSWAYEVIEAGYKYNLTDMAAALGRVQLRRLVEMRDGRARIARAYDEAFGEFDALELPPTRDGVYHAWHLYPIRLRLPALRIERADFIREMRAAEIGTSVHFIPLHTQPFYAEKYGYRREDFPVAEEEFPRLVSLPIYSSMTDEDVGRVIDAVSAIARCHAR
jgi:perosamine synthetase